MQSLKPVYNGPSTDSLLSVYAPFFFFFFHYALFSCCNFSLMHIFFLCCIFCMQHVFSSTVFFLFHFTLFSLCTLFRLLFSCFFFPSNIFSCFVNHSYILLKTSRGNLITSEQMLQSDDFFPVIKRKGRTIITLLENNVSQVTA